jgi:hypothetical protein
MKNTAIKITNGEYVAFLERANYVLSDKLKDVWLDKEEYDDLQFLKNPNPNLTSRETAFAVPTVFHARIIRNGSNVAYFTDASLSTLKDRVETYIGVK